MIRVLTIIGTRPEAIKMSPVVRALRERSDIFESRICVTGQHRALMDQMLSLFGLTADTDLGVMLPGQSLASLAGGMLKALDGLLRAEQPDWVLIQGDTSTTFAAGLAAFYHGVRVAHVEAGLRTYNRHHPFPEEVHRRMVSALADLHFAPTARAAQNLLAENIPADSVLMTGNTAVDAALYLGNLTPEGPVAGLAGLSGLEPMVVVTAHRRENLGAGMERICAAVRRLALAHPEVVFVWPVHPNPEVTGPVHQHLSNLSNVRLLPPLDYPPMLHLLRRAHLVLTDSGGLQEEAAVFGKPVLVLRETTERPEGVDAGLAMLVGNQTGTVVDAVEDLLGNPERHARMARVLDVYGDGRAALRMVEALGGRHQP